MKDVAAILILAVLPMQEQNPSKGPEVRRVTLKAVNSRIPAIVARLREKTGIPIEFDDNAKKRIEGDGRSLSIEVKDTTVLAPLQRVCLPRPLQALCVGQRNAVVATNP